MGDCPHTNVTKPVYNGGNYGNYGTQRCLDCEAVRDDWSDWTSPHPHEPGIVCVDCSHPDNIPFQQRVFHPANRGCVLRTEKEDSE